MKKFFVTALLSLATIMAFSASAQAYVETSRETGMPAADFPATDIAREPTHTNVGDSPSYIKGINNRYTVNNHNGQNIVMVTARQGRIIADKGPKLKGLLVTTPSHYRNTLKSKFADNGFFVEGLAILTDDSDIKKHYEKNYAEAPISEELLNNIIRDTIVFMRDKNQPIVDVYFPEQDVSDGYIVALVQRAVIDKIIVSGNQYYTADEILQFVTSKPGDYIWSDDLSKDLRWINSYPYRQTDVIFKPGEKPKTTDMIFETKDMYPFRLFGGVDNYGSKTTGMNQFYGGFSYGDLWDIDHEFIYTFGSSFDLKNFNSHTVQYIAPIPDWRDKLSFTGNVSYSEPRSSTPISQNGTNYTLNMNYDMPLYDYGLRGFVQSLDMGIDYKRLENDIEFGGTNVFSSAPEIVDFYIGYEGTKTSAITSNTFSATFIASPGGLMSNNTDSDFDTATAGANSQYAYGKGLYETKYTDENTNLTFSALFRGQFSPNRLLSSEQMSITGPGAVRGFGSNTIRRDSGFITTLEISSPYIPVIDQLVSFIIRDRLQGFAFYDHGWGHDSNSTGALSSIQLDSAGVGARFGISRNLSGTIEYGREVHDELKDGHDQKVNFRLNASY